MELMFKDNVGNEPYRHPSNNDETFEYLSHYYYAFSSFFLVMGG